MADEVRSPKWGFLLMIVLLVGSLAGTAWWFQRGQSSSPPKPTLDDPDVYCTGRVDAAGHVTALDPTQPGRVTEVLVSEGQTVTAEQELIRLDDAAAQARLIQAQAAVDAAQVDLDVALRDKERVPNQLAAREAVVNAAAARVEAARKLLQQRREQKNVAPLGQAEEEALQAQIREVEQMEMVQRAELADLRRLDPELRVRAARARLKASQADLALAEHALRDCAIRAPQAGTILRLQAAVGGLISPGSPVPAVVFAPAGPPVVRAEIDQEALGRVVVGMPAEVQDENRPEGPVWKGRVRQLAKWVAQRRTYVLEPGELNDVRTLEAVIELEGPTDGLWIGQRMRVRLIRGADDRPDPSPAR